MKRRNFIYSGGSLILGGMLAMTNLGFAGEPGKIVPYKVLSVRCNGCMHCIRSCQQKVLVMQSGKAFIDSARCMGCGDCARYCRRQAIVPAKP